MIYLQLKMLITVKKECHVLKHYGLIMISDLKSYDQFIEEKSYRKINRKNTYSKFLKIILWVLLDNLWNFENSKKRKF